MSCACSPLSGETDRESNMGDVLGKETEGTEDQFSVPFGENMEREEAEGAEDIEERSSNGNEAERDVALDPGESDKDQPKTVLAIENEEDENQMNQVKEDQLADLVEAVNNSSINDNQIPIVPSEDNAKWDLTNSDCEFDAVVDYEDEDDDEDDEEEDDDDDEEGAVDADDEDDFAENEVTDRSKGIADPIDTEDIQTKRADEIKVNSDCVYSSSDSSDDSGVTSNKKSLNGGRICDSVRRRKIMKVKETIPARSSNIPSQEDQRAVLAEAMTNLTLDGVKPTVVCEKGETVEIIKRMSDENLLDGRPAMPEKLQMSVDLKIAKTESESEASQTPQITREAMKSDGVLTSEEENSSLNEEDIKELMRQEALQRRRESCTCEACQSKRLQMQEQRKLQGAWMELRHFVRGVYHVIMETPPDGVMPIVGPSQDEHMKAIAKRLTKSDPHQLYHRLQAQVHEFASAVKVRLHEIIEDNSGNSSVATEFFEGLFHGYEKLSVAAKRVAPLLKDLELRHLSRFNLTWELLNKAIYYQVVYNDENISNKLPEMVTLGQEFQKMIRFYMAFDDDMNIIQAKWRESFDLLQKYNNQQAKIRAKQQMLLRDWEIFKAQRYQRSFDEGIELDRHSNAPENGPEIEEGMDMVICPSCNLVQSCPCDECCLAHLFSCPAHQPAVRSDYSPTLDGPRIAGDGAGDTPSVEHNQGNTSEQKCECHVCTAPPAGPEIDGVVSCGPGYFCNSNEDGHPQINQSPSHHHPSTPYQFLSHQAGSGDGNGVYPHLYNIHPSLLHSAGTKYTSDACGHSEVNQVTSVQRLGDTATVENDSDHHCQNHSSLSSEKGQPKTVVKILKAVKQGEKKCNTSASLSKGNFDLQHINGVTRSGVLTGSGSSSEANALNSARKQPREALPLTPQAQPKANPQPQPRARFTAGPGVNVPDTDSDIYPDPPADYRFTAGPGVNVPDTETDDTDLCPDPPADFAAAPPEFTGEVAPNSVLKLDASSKDTSFSSMPTVEVSTKPDPNSSQEPVFVLTKAGVAPPSNIPSLQPKPTAVSSTVLKEKNAANSNLPSQPTSTSPNAAKGSTVGGPTIQGLLEEALERKKAEMARAAAVATARESTRTVSTPSAPIAGPATPPTTSQPKAKQGHTCSSAKHKQHTHSPSHRDPKNCDCCFCEMFGHGAPPAAPTSHRFHENRQRLRSKLNKSRASKQQAAGVKPGATAAAAGTVRPAGAPAGAAGAPAVKTVVATQAAAKPAATAVLRSSTVGAGAPAGPAAPAAVASAGARPAAVGAPAAPGASVVVKTALPASTAAAVTRTMTVTASARMPGPGVPVGCGPSGPASGATAARAIAYSVTSGCKSSPTAPYLCRPVPVKPVIKQEGTIKMGSKIIKTTGTLVPKAVAETMKNAKTNFAPPLCPPQTPSFTPAAGSGRLGTAFTTCVGKNSLEHPPSASSTVRPSHVAAAKLAEAGINKMKAQPTSSAKPTVLNSNQRVIATPTGAKGTVQQVQQVQQVPRVPQTNQTTQAVQTAVPQKKVVMPAVVREEPAKKEDPRPIDELLDFIEGDSNSQPKTADSKKAAKKARQKQKKLEQQEENLQTQTPDVTITMLKDAPDSDRTAKGKKGSGKRTEEVISTIPSATAQSIRDRIKSQVGEVAKKMGSSDQPQMVTIRRVMEPNSSEPTVTITLKGATPDKDKVLFTLVNGQNEVVCHDQANAQPKSKKQRKLERRMLRQQQLHQIQVEEGVDEEECEEDYEQEEEEIDMSMLTKTQRKKLRRLQKKQEEERLAEEQRRLEELQRQQEEEERRKREEAERLQQQKSKKNSKKDKAQKVPSQPQPNSKKSSKPTQKGNLSPEPTSKTNKGSKVNSAPDSDDEFVVPVQMTKKERKIARKLQQQLEEEQRRQRQKEEEEREKQRQQELKEQKKKQKELQKLKQQQQKQQEKQQQKLKEAEKKQQKQNQSKSQASSQQQQQQQQKQQKQKQTASKQQPTKTSKQGGKITTSIIPNPLTLGSYMPPVGSLEWTTQALAASRPNVTIQPASSASSSLGGLEQRFSTTLTLNGKPIVPPPRQPSPEPSQDFSLENLKLPPGITITKVDPSQVQQRKPPVSKPQVTKTVVANPAPTTIIAAPLSGNRPPNTYNSGSSQDPNSNVIVVDTGKLKHDIAKREEEPEQVVTRKKKNNKKNNKAPEPAPRPQVPSQLPPFIYGMNSVSITPTGQQPNHQAAPPPPQAAIIKMNGNMVTIRNPAMHPAPQRYIGPDLSEKETGNGRKVVTNGIQNVPPNRNKEHSNLPPRFANAKLSQQANGVNGFVQHRPQHYDSSPQTFEVPKPHKLHYETPPRHFESRHFEAPQHYEQAPHYDANSLHFQSAARHYDPKPHHFETASRPFEPSPHHFDHPGRHFEPSAHPFEHAGRHFEKAPHHFEHSVPYCDQSAHLYNAPTQHDKHTKHIHPQNYAAAIEGKKSKLKKAYNNDDWQLVDSVFAPKDIDLDDGDIDADERELEAFKRFCLQSVPPKRKEKVHLNIEDIVLKKKSSIVSCT